MSDDIQNQILRLQALSVIQTADISALLALYSSIRECLKDAAPELPTLEGDFLILRKQFLHAQLENIENSNPALAAKIQESIDSSSKIFPFDY